MTLGELATQLEWEHLTPELDEAAERPVEYAYATDLLSDVLGCAPHGGVLITIQAHLNAVAVAVHAEQAAVVFASGRRIDDKVRARAVEEGIPLYGSTDTAFDVAGKLYALGLRGRRL